MPMYQPPWEINPLEYLVRTKFPLASSIAAASSPYASANTHERARVAEDQVAGYREELKALPPNEIARRARTRQHAQTIIGTAIKGYGYDPRAGRSGTVREIADDLRLAGLALDVDTIRKYLNEAKELLPGPETEQKA